MVFPYSLGLVTPIYKPLLFSRHGQISEYMSQTQTPGIIQQTVFPNNKASTNSITEVTAASLTPLCRQGPYKRARTSLHFRNILPHLYLTPSQEGAELISSGLVERQGLHLRSESALFPRGGPSVRETSGDTFSKLRGNSVFYRQYFAAKI